MQASEAAQDVKRFLSSYRRTLLPPVLIKAGATLCQIACFWFFADMMHSLLVEQTDYAPSSLYAFGVVACLWIGLRHVGQGLERSLNYRVCLDLQQAIEEKLNRQQYVLANQHAPFQWQQIYLQHITSMANFVSQYASQKYLSVIIPLCVLVLLFPVDTFVTFILLFTLPIVPVFMILVGHGAANLHRKHFVSLERLGGLFVDRLKALTLITSFNQHEQQSQYLNTASQLVNQKTMKVVGVAFLSTTVLDFFSTVSIALVAVYIGFTLLGELSLGQKIPFNEGLFLLLVAPLLFSELKNLGRLYHQKSQAEAAWDSLRPVLYSPDGKDKGDVFDGVNWLNFHSEAPELCARSISLHKGERIYLQGASGAGKTQFLNALMGFKAASHRLPGHCVLLGQKPTLLSDSVRQNLCLDKTFSDQALWSVLRDVALDKVIENLPEGLETPLGEHPPLSGGEAQRLGLARVLLQSADVVLLDEPTAHLTAQQHDELAQLINRVTEGKTVIWASHKFLPENWFNHVWTISDGRLTTKRLAHA